MNRVSAGALTLLAIVGVGFGLAVLLARMTPASQERTWWRGVLDSVFARSGGTAATGQEDWPPIVVRGPAFNVDGGDRLSQSPQWRGWTLVSTSQAGIIWKPDFVSGPPVRTFEVLALNAIGTQTCPLVPFLADRVDLVYAGTAKPQTVSIHTLPDKSRKAEPVIDTTLQLTTIPGNETAPDTLSYTADGVLTGFTASYQQRGAASCTFNAQGGAYLRLLPLR